MQVSDQACLIKSNLIFWRFPFNIVRGRGAIGALHRGSEAGFVQGREVKAEIPGLLITKSLLNIFLLKGPTLRLSFLLSMENNIRKRGFSN